MVDTSPVDTSVFTANFINPTKTLVIYSIDVSKAGFYDFLITVFYTVQPTVQVTT